MYKITSTSKDRRFIIGPQSRHVQQKDGSFAPRENFDDRLIKFDTQIEDQIEDPTKRLGRVHTISDARAKVLEKSAAFKALSEEVGVEMVQVAG
jgi:hypothetical protein